MSRPSGSSSRKHIPLSTSCFSVNGLDTGPLPRLFLVLKYFYFTYRGVGTKSRSICVFGCDGVKVKDLESTRKE